MTSYASSSHTPPRNNRKVVKEFKPTAEQILVAERRSLAVFDKFGGAIRAASWFGFWPEKFTTGIASSATTGAANSPPPSVRPLTPPSSRARLPRLTAGSAGPQR